MFSRPSISVLVATLACICLADVQGLAHRGRDAYLKWTVDGGTARGQWDMAILDLDAAVDLDENNDGAITLSELTARERVVKAYALTHLELRIDGAVVEFQVEKVGASRLADGVYATLDLVTSTPPSPGKLELCYRAFADLDPLHRCFATVDHGTASATAVLSPKSECHEFDLAAMRPWGQVRSFLKEGVWHIWTGYDHILFLLALLFPSVMALAETRRWEPASQFKPCLWMVLKVVTAFTAAHSITLGLAATGWVRFPSRWVECTIAFSVALAALNNLRPWFRERGWWVAFGFGLIHGFGFASALGETPITRQSMALGLVSFNAGVEIGQLAIVSLFLPLAFLSRRTWFYQGLVLRVGSCAIVLLACLWLVERALDLKLL